MERGLGDLLKRFPEREIVVIGDVMLDETLTGPVERISPEAPVCVVKVDKRTYEAGGAGNVAANISSLKGKVSIFSFTGQDPESEILERKLKEKKIQPYFDKNYKTTRKLRIVGIMGNQQQLVRADDEDVLEKKFTKDIEKTLLEKAKQAEIIIISDYAKGTITPSLIELLEQYRRKTIIDPKPRNRTLDYLKSLYSNVFLITPNETEAREMSGCSEIYETGTKLRAQFNSDILITRGKKGMTLFSNTIKEIPTSVKEVSDVTGAGDTVIAALSLALASGSSLEQAANIANYAAGIAVGKIGAYSVRLDELKNKIMFNGGKIVTLQELEKIVESYKIEGKKIVWTNGCFELLHPGHIYSLEKAKEKGDILIVGLDSDESVRALKGPERPLVPERYRAKLLSTIEIVDHIIVFPPDGAAECLIKISPDIYVKSGDYTLETIDQEERRIVESYGGEIFLPKGIPGYSTTNIIRKIRNH